MDESIQESLGVLSRGINAELAAYVFYKRAAEKVDNSELAEFFIKLAGEEKDHYWTLEAEYDSLVRSEKWVTYNDIMRRSELPEIPEEMAENHQRRIDELDTIADNYKILQLAIELEQEAHDLYNSQIEKIDDPIAKEMLGFLAKFELGHVKVLTKWLENL